MSVSIQNKRYSQKLGSQSSIIVDLAAQLVEQSHASVGANRMVQQVILASAEIHSKAATSRTTDAEAFIYREMLLLE